MPTVQDFIARARERKRDFSESIYPFIEIHENNTGNNKHKESLSNLGLLYSMDVLELIHSTELLSRLHIDIVGYSGPPWSKTDMSTLFSSTNQGVVTAVKQNVLFKGKLYPLKQSVIDLKQVRPTDWDQVIWSCSLRYLPGEGLVEFSVTDVYIPEDENVILLGTYSRAQGLFIEQCVRMFNFRLSNIPV